MSKSLDEAKHHFIIELDSEDVDGRMRCNHKQDDEEFCYKSGKYFTCKVDDTFYGMSDCLIYFEGGGEFLEVKLKEINGDLPKVEDGIAIGKYIEAEDGDVSLTVEGGYHEGLSLMLNGESIMVIDAEINARKVAFPVEVISLDDSEINLGSCKDMKWVITGVGEEL